MKIAIAVQGRFFAFDLARALLARGHDVVLLTNYPKWVVRRFGLPVSCVRSFRTHGILTKVVSFVDPDGRFSSERWMNPAFGRWARCRLREEGHWDRILSFSGVSEEILRDPQLGPACFVVRASAHIQVQADILEEEQRRAGRRLDHPSPWIVAREKREYELAPAIVVLSDFAYATFLAQGIAADKLRLLPLGTQPGEFSPDSAVVEARIRRIRSGAPLTIVYAGNMSYQKGMLDMAEVIRELAGPRFRFRLVGRVMPEARSLFRDLPPGVELIGKVPQNALPDFYATGDLFLFPTVQDGFAIVLAQALAGALPVLSTENCSAPELLREGGGWTVPIRRPDLFAERIRWCDLHREDFAAVVESLHSRFRPRHYEQVAADFERLCLVEPRGRDGRSVRSVRGIPAGSVPDRRLKVAVVVHGRFHAFDLARALLAQGTDVTVFTSYPYWVAERWGIPRGRLKTFPLQGVLARLGGWFRQWTAWSTDPFLLPLFGSWAVRKLRRGHWDAIYSFSGISENILREPRLAGALRMVVRGSAHIREQADILAREGERTGRRLEQPGPWIVAREEREYALADLVVVLSSFAAASFRAAGVSESKLRVLPLGTETSAFRPGPEILEARRARILSGAPLRVLYVGNVSYQKGLADYAEVVRNSGGRFHFRVVGTVTAEARDVVASLGDAIEVGGRRPQNELPEEYSAADLFIFPTLQDGYAVVLAQASAAGLPILTTTNCCGPDLVREGLTGWVLPVRDPGAFLRRLEWCDTHRAELAEMVSVAWLEFRTRDWSDVAADFSGIVRDWFAGPAEGDESRIRQSAALAEIPHGSVQ